MTLLLVAHWSVRRKGREFSTVLYKSRCHLETELLNDKVLPAKFWRLFAFTMSALISNFTWKSLTQSIVLVSLIRQWYLARCKSKSLFLRSLFSDRDKCMSVVLRHRWNAAHVRQESIRWSKDHLWSYTNNSKQVQKRQMWLEDVRRKISSLEKFQYLEYHVKLVRSVR